jgi:hypothetical protein
VCSSDLIGPLAAAGISLYVQEVRQRRFPTAEHRWKMKQQEADDLAAWLAENPA